MLRYSTNLAFNFPLSVMSGLSFCVASSTASNICWLSLTLAYEAQLALPVIKTISTEDFQILDSTTLVTDSALV